MIRKYFHLKDLENVFSSNQWTSCGAKHCFGWLERTNFSPFCKTLNGINHTRGNDASVIFQGFTLLLVSQATSKVIINKKTGGNLTAQSTGPQGNWMWISSYRDVVASSPFFFRPAARAPQRACSQASRKGIFNFDLLHRFAARKISTTIHFHFCEYLLISMVQY